MLDGKVEGFFLFGENPAVGSANSRLHRMAMANLDWLVVRDLVEIESASFWHDAPELETGELKTEEIATEVFLLPAASHVEKSGSFTNTQRLLQWHFKAVEPSGDCRSDLWFVYHLGLRIRDKLADSDDPRDRPLLDLEWDYPTEGPLEDPSADAVLREISGWDADGRAVSSFAELKPDGSTVCGCWIYSGCYADEVNQAARKKPGQEQTWVAPEWGWAWPSNRRILYNRASADPERQAVVRAQALRLVGRAAGALDGPRRARLRSRQAARLRAAGRREGRRGDPRRPPVHHAGRRTRLAVRPQRARRRAVPDALRAAGVAVPQPALRPAVQPGAQAASPPPQPVQPDRRRAGSGLLPVRADDLPADRAPHRGRHVPDRALPRRDPAGDVLRGLARARRRARPRERRLGDDHHGARRDRGARARHRAVSRRSSSQGRPLHQIAVPWHWGTRGLSTGESANDLFGLALDPNVQIQEVRGATCDIRPAAARAAGPCANSLSRTRTSRCTSRDRIRPARAREDAAQLARELRRRGAAAAGLLHRHERLHRLQGLRGRLQGVERRPRGRAAVLRRVVRQHRLARRQQLAPRRLHRAADTRRRTCRRPTAPCAG